MKKVPSCYHCKFWDYDFAKSGKGGELFAYCENPDKNRPDTGAEPCPSTAGDYCVGFEPVGGWTDEWGLAKNERECEEWMEEFESILEE
jgi:hypothetical protein